LYACTVAVAAIGTPALLNPDVVNDTQTQSAANLSKVNAINDGHPFQFADATLTYTNKETRAISTTMDHVGKMRELVDLCRSIPPVSRQAASVPAGRTGSKNQSNIESAE